MLTAPHNFAVVQLPGRQFPGVVFQGDSLATFCEQANLIAEQTRGSDAYDEAADLRDGLNEILRSYVAVLEGRGTRLPFGYRPPAE